MATGAIRWSDKDESALRLAVRNWNQNIRRRTAKDPEASAYLPEKKSLKAERAKAQTGTRKDFNSQIRWIREFGKPKAAEKVVTPAGLVTTRFELKRANELQRRMNLKAAAHRKKFANDYKKGLDDPEIEAKGRKKETVFELEKPGDFKRKVEQMETRLSKAYADAGAEQYKRNYMKSIENNMGAYADRLLETVAKMDAKKLYELTNKNVEMKITFMYGSKPAEQKFNRIAAHFEQAGYPVEGYDEFEEDADEDEF